MRNPNDQIAERVVDIAARHHHAPVFDDLFCNFGIEGEARLARGQ